MKSLRLFLLLACSLLAMPVRAELPPSVYEAMQEKAPEYVKIEVLRVDVEPGEDPAQQKITVVAMVNDVMRTASNLKPNDLINIIYTVTERPKGWVGPGQVPVPVAQDRSIAFLTKLPNGDFAPAAGRMTFSKF